MQSSGMGENRGAPGLAFETCVRFFLYFNIYNETQTYDHAA
jgi:hypothetical protein